MAYHAFICHPSKDAAIVENLAGRLRDLGVEAWVYSLDRTLSEGVWSEIEQRVTECQLFIFVGSSHSLDAQGQHRELQLALERLKQTNVGLKMVPVLLDNLDFGSLPAELSHVNGLTLDAHTVKSTAQAIATTFFHELVAAYKNKDWRCPYPGQWLEICNLDQWTEEKFELGDRVYFRRRSPLGLFECYAPKLEGLFWFAPHSLRVSSVADENGMLEREEVPRSYRYSASYDFERLGIDEMKKRGAL